MKARPNRDGLRWSKRDDTRLEWAWGTYDLASIAIRLERTTAAVRRRAEELKLGAMRRGAESLAQLARRLGYDRETIVRAAKLAGVTLRRQPRGTKATKKRHYMISEEESAKLMEHLDARGVRRARCGWGAKGGTGGRVDLPMSCIECNTTSSPHYGHGRCRLCYHRNKARDARTTRNEEDPGSAPMGECADAC
jgi:hypothetical protein